MSVAIPRYQFRVAEDATLGDFGAGPGDVIAIRNEPLPGEYIARTEAEFELRYLSGLARDTSEERVRWMLRRTGSPLAEAEFPEPYPWMSYGEAEEFQSLGLGRIEVA